MKSYESIKKESYIDIDMKLKYLLKNYFKLLSDQDLAQICEDIVTKYSENRQLEKLKSLKKLFFVKKEQEKNFLVKNFIQWKAKTLATQKVKQESLIRDTIAQPQPKPLFEEHYNNNNNNNDNNITRKINNSVTNNNISDSLFNNSNNAFTKLSTI